MDEDALNKKTLTSKRKLKERKMREMYVKNGINECLKKIEYKPHVLRPLEFWKATQTVKRKDYLLIED